MRSILFPARAGSVTASIWTPPSRVQPKRPAPLGKGRGYSLSLRLQRIPSRFWPTSSLTNRWIGSLPAPG